MSRVVVFLIYQVSKEGEAPLSMNEGGEEAGMWVFASIEPSDSNEKTSKVEENEGKYLAERREGFRSETSRRGEVVSGTSELLPAVN